MVVGAAFVVFFFQEQTSQGAYTELSMSMWWERSGQPAKGWFFRSVYGALAGHRSSFWKNAGTTHLVFAVSVKASELYVPSVMRTASNQNCATLKGVRWMNCHLEIPIFIARKHILDHRITECKGLEGTSVDHLVQPPDVRC